MDGSIAPEVTQLKRLIAPRPATVERCGLCDAEIADDHGHLVDTVSRSLVCACRACRLLFEPNRSPGRFRFVPERYESMNGDDGSRWDALDIPVGVAFFFVNSALRTIAALYPSPAGATESTLPLDAWNDIVAARPRLASMEPDVEAWLVRRDRSSSESFIVPIDACYELVGIIRREWKGFDGGEMARQAIDGFFARVRARCTLPEARVS